MIIEFNDSILERNSDDPVIRQAVESAAIETWRGNHFIFGSRKTLEFLASISGLTAESKSIIEKCLGNYATSAAFLKSIPIRVEICCRQTYTSKREDRWILPVERLTHGISPTVLLTENLTDAYLYDFAAKHYALISEGGTSFKVSCRGGGGSTTPDCLKAIIAEAREWVLCLTDSDKSSPQAPFGNVSIRCEEEASEARWIAKHNSIPGKTLENVLPHQLIDISVPVELRPNWDEYNRITKTGERPWAKYTNLKTGNTVRWIRRLPNGGADRPFWNEIAREIGIDLADCTCVEFDCIRDDKCGKLAIPALGSRIGEHVLAYLRENSVQRSFQLAKKSANFELWMEIGKAVFNFGLAPKRARS
ncbi:MULTISPECIES: hypothetical protein [unclassified Herbaspirillum]|uniref:hypothetical protein n=1 Tax=unclassified Herbaspirillum TaxID=2624150 RepID=UPI0025800156|nr:MULTISPECIES: hypothetical protein [unclassified Herbaspirillum]|tara:strand:+ start:329 stop:1417 length:1089 start_codon:yes stop_codon:yes gene_type:complete